MPQPEHKIEFHTHGISRWRRELTTCCQQSVHTIPRHHRITENLDEVSCPLNQAGPTPSMDDPDLQG